MRLHLGIALAGESVLPLVVEVGWTVNTGWVAAARGDTGPELSASTVASHVLGELKFQVH